MPITKINYQNTIIYKIVADDEEKCSDVYVGSTTDFIRRKGQHKRITNLGINQQKLYKMIRDNGGWDNWSMLEVKKFPCNDGNESRAEEERVRKELKADLNSIRCWRESKFCIEEGCKSGAISKTDYCVSHGGGKRCIEEGCKTGAEGKTDFCKKHGGGNRCIEEGCKVSTQGLTDFCISHGGGKRCIEEGCKTGAQGKTDCCVSHGGGKRCIEEGCKVSAIGKTDYCAKHGQQHTCLTCNKTLSIGSVKRHEKSKKHLKLLEN